MLNFGIYFFFNGSAAPKDIIQITSDHVAMFIRTWNKIQNGYVKIQNFFFSLHPTVQLVLTKNMN